MKDIDKVRKKEIQIKMEKCPECGSELEEMADWPDPWLICRECLHTENEYNITKPPKTLDALISIALNHNHTVRIEKGNKHGWKFRIDDTIIANNYPTEILEHPLSDWAGKELEQIKSSFPEFFQKLSSGDSDRTLSNEKSRQNLEDKEQKEDECFVCGEEVRPMIDDHYEFHTHDDDGFAEIHLICSGLPDGVERDNRETGGRIWKR